MNRLSQAMLRSYSHELPARDLSGHPDDPRPDPYAMARMMTDHNNKRAGVCLDWTTECRQAPDLTWYTVGYVFDATGQPSDGGGDVQVCWWQCTPCPECEGYGSTEIFHPSTDGLIGHRPCTQKHPAPPPPAPPAPVKHLDGCNGDDVTLDACCPPF